MLDRVGGHIAAPSGGTAIAWFATGVQVQMPSCAVPCFCLGLLLAAVSCGDDDASRPQKPLASDDAALPDAAAVDSADVDAGPRSPDSPVALDAATPPDTQPPAHDADASVPEHPPMKPMLAPLPSPLAGVCAFARADLPVGPVDNPRCPDGVFHGDLIISNADDIAALKGCVRLDGNLNVATTSGFVDDGLSDLRGLEALRIIDGWLSIPGCLVQERCHDNRSLTSFRGLDALRCVSGDVRLGEGEGYKQLHEIGGLGELTEVGGNFSCGISGVSDPDRLSKLRRVWGDVPALLEIPLSGLETVYGGRVYVSYATTPLRAPRLTYEGCAQTEDPCRDKVMGCSFSANNQGQLDHLAGCQLALRDITLLGPNVIDLTPLAQLREVRGSLALDGTGSVLPVATLKGLGALEHAGSLAIRAADVKDLKPLAKLRTVDRLELSQLHLSGLSGLEDLDWKALVISQCSVKSLQGLRIPAELNELELNGLDLTSLAELAPLHTAGRLTLNDLKGLNDLQGLNQLESAGELTISWNAFTQLQGLDALTTVGYLEIEMNPQLTSLRALAKLGSVNSLTVKDNTSLPACEVDWLQQRILRGPSLIDMPLPHDPCQ